MDELFENDKEKFKDRPYKNSVKKIGYSWAKKAGMFGFVFSCIKPL